MCVGTIRKIHIPGNHFTYQSVFYSIEEKRKGDEESEREKEKSINNSSGGRKEKNHFF